MPTVPPPRRPPLPPGEGSPTVTEDPLLGMQLGEYQVREVLGTGGMGVVYGALQPMIGKRVAIKVLQWEVARNPEEVARLLAEARLVNAIRHRGIVDIFNFGQLPDGRHYLVMELLEGEPLDKVIAARAPLEVDEVLQILDEVADALAAAHGAGVIHRDLKPNNVFLVTPPHGSRYVKLLDFGLAKKTSSPRGSAAQTRTDSVVGTPYYMAPEQARALPVSPQTDLYALGVMAFELLTGKLPFDGESPFDVISKHVNEPPPRVTAFERSVPVPLADLVDLLLAKDPAQRPESAAGVRRELQHLRHRLQADATQVGGVALAPSTDPEVPLSGLTPLTPLPTPQDGPATPALDVPTPVRVVRTAEFGVGVQRVETAKTESTTRPLGVGLWLGLLALLVAASAGAYLLLLAPLGLEPVAPVAPVEPVESPAGEPGLAAPAPETPAPKPQEPVVAAPSEPTPVPLEELRPVKPERPEKKAPPRRREPPSAEDLLRRLDAFIAAEDVRLKDPNASDKTTVVLLRSWRRDLAADRSVPKRREIADLLRKAEQQRAE